MMLVTSAIAGALVVGGGGAPASRTASRTSTPQMMPKFLKEMFPTLEKPEDATRQWPSTNQRSPDAVLTPTAP
jgi:hypothetical protein